MGNEHSFATIFCLVIAAGVAGSCGVDAKRSAGSGVNEVGSETQPPAAPAQGSAPGRSNDSRTLTPSPENVVPSGARTCDVAQTRCGVEFSIDAGNESAMELRGDFIAAGWASGTPMMKAGTKWTATVAIRPGKRVEYKYCVDPRADGSCTAWKADARAATTAPSGNNVIEAVPACTTATCADVVADVRFVAVGDTGKGNANQTAVANAMAAKCQTSGCEFGLLLGDNIYESGASSATDPLFDARFERVYAPVGVPFYVVLGNHDYGGNGAGSESFKGQFEVDHTAHSSIWKMPAAYYRFTQSNVTFFGLDTNAILYGNDTAQRNDVAAWIAGANTSWKIAIGHHPYLSNGPHGNAGSYDGRPAVPVFNGATMKSFAEDVVCGKVDLYLCGHDHVRQWITSTCSGTELAVSGAGSAPTSLPGSNATRFQSTDLGFLYVTISGKRLVAEFVDTHGNTNFTRTLAK